MCVNKLDYFVRYYSEANLVTAQQVIPYTMSSSFALVFFGLSTQLPRPIPPLLDLENIDKTHGGKAFSHTFGSHESTGAAPPTPSKVCSGCGLSEEMFAKQLEALRRKKLDSEAALPKAPTSGKVGRTPVLMVVDSVGDAAMIEACFDTVETASAKFRTSQGLLPNTNMLPIFNDRTSLILELGKKKIEDSVMYEVNARLQFYKTQPSEWQDLVKKYFSIADHLKEVAHNSPSWDNFYKQHYTQLVGLYLLQEVSGEVDWGWRADRARVGVVAATVRR
jgi:hypothetical protein